MLLKPNYLVRMPTGFQPFDRKFTLDVFSILSINILSKHQIIFLIFFLLLLLLLYIHIYICNSLFLCSYSVFECFFSLFLFRFVYLVHLVFYIMIIGEFLNVKHACARVVLVIYIIYIRIIIY